MAVDRPGDYVGNHGGAYKDNNGMCKQFTYVDHDVKTKISGFTEIDKVQVKKELGEYRASIIDEILDTSASLCPVEFDSFIIRGTPIVWNKTMLTDPGVSFDRLRDLYTILDNRKNLRQITQ